MTVLTKTDKIIRHHKRPGMQRRLGLGNILGTVARLNAASAVQDTAGYRMDILKQAVRGALSRLKKQNPFQLTLPPKVEAARLASAMKSQMGD